MKYPTPPYIRVPLSFLPRVQKLDSLGQINSIVIKIYSFYPYGVYSLVENINVKQKMTSVWIHGKLKVLTLLYNLQLAKLLFLPLHQIADLQYKWAPCFSIPPFIAFYLISFSLLWRFIYIYIFIPCVQHWVRARNVNVNKILTSWERNYVHGCPPHSIWSSKDRLSPHSSNMVIMHFPSLFTVLRMPRPINQKAAYGKQFTEIWGWKWKLLSHVWLFATPWTVACQVPLSMDFSRPEYWNG